MAHQKIAFLLVICLFAIGLLLSSCSKVQETQQREIPLVSLEFVIQAGGVVNLRAPLHINDTNLLLAEYDARGDLRMQYYNEVTFPTDVIVVYTAANQAVSVYLRRSPQGGCLLLWDSENSWIHDPCFGSRFDQSGQYKFGPSPRNLDQLPAELRDGIVWVGAEVIYGEPHP